MTLADVISLVGLAFAIVQVMRTRSAAVKTRKKIEEVATRISLYNVLLVVPELARIESELERCAVDDNGEDARRLLKDWRELASDLRGMLETHEVAAASLPTHIQNSLSLANQAKARLVSDPCHVQYKTVKARESMEVVCQEARTLAGRIRVLIGDPDLDRDAPRLEESNKGQGKDDVQNSR